MYSTVGTAFLSVSALSFQHTEPNQPCLCIRTSYRTGVSRTRPSAGNYDRFLLHIPAVFPSPLTPPHRVRFRRRGSPGRQCQCSLAPISGFTEAPQTDTASGKELFYVERIIARSTDTFPRRGGGREHRYLVRWWSYTPNEDTWEPKSELVKTVPSVLEAFDANGQLHSPCLPMPSCLG